MDERLFGISRRQLDTARQQPCAWYPVEPLADLVDKRLSETPVAATRGHDRLQVKSARIVRTDRQQIACLGEHLAVAAKFAQRRRALDHRHDVARLQGQDPVVPGKARRITIAVAQQIGRHDQRIDIVVVDRQRPFGGGNRARDIARHQPRPRRVRPDQGVVGRKLQRQIHFAQRGRGIGRNRSPHPCGIGAIGRRDFTGIRHVADARDIALIEERVGEQMAHLAERHAGAHRRLEPRLCR